MLKLPARVSLLERAIASQGRVIKKQHDRIDQLESRLAEFDIEGRVET